MPDISNYAAIHKPEMVAAIDAADVPTLERIDADLAREGWAADGVMRSRIAARKAALTHG